MSIANLAAAALWGAAGVGLFFFLLNRWVLMRKDHAIKFPLALLAFAALIAGALLHGFRTGCSPQVAIPVAMLALALLGEIRRLVLRRRMRGAPPVARSNTVVALHRPLRTTTLALWASEEAMPSSGPRPVTLLRSTGIMA